VRSTWGVVAGLALLLGVPAAAGALAPDTGQAGAARLMAAPAHGKGALTRLGADLAEAAQRNRMTSGTLSETLRSDESAWVDPAGRLFYADVAPADATGPTSAASFSYDQTFLLHSRPTATRVIYLDFDGYDLHDTAWNAAGTPALTVPAYTRDGDPAFSAAELDVVQEVWARVAEDYAPFGVDVTTQDPGTAGLARTSADDLSYGSRVAITTDLSLRSTISGCGGGCAGVAYVGTFDSVVTGYPEYYQPAFDLAAPSYSAATIAEIAAHEVGHHLGLRHDGEGTSAYYRDPDGTRIWSPVMGAGYTPLTQFSIGDYPGATQTQDDYDVIGQHGPTLVGDDFGNGTVTAYPVGGTAVSLQGLIGTRTDVDSFRVTRSCSGPLTASVSPAALGADLDARLRLLDSSGAALAVSSPTTARGGAWSPVVTGLGAALSVQLGPGTYYLEIDGVGLDDPTLGYSDYGSTGRYGLAVSGCDGVAASVTAPSVPVVVAADRDAAAHGLRLAWDAPAASGGSAVTSYVVTVNGGSPVTLPASARGHTFYNLLPQTAYTLGVSAANAAGTGPVATVAATTGAFSGVAVTPTADPSAGPTSTPSVSPSSSPTSSPTTPVTSGTSGTPTMPLASPTTVPTARPAVSVPSAPLLARVRGGRPGGVTTVKVTWRPPVSTGGAVVTAYDVHVWRVDRRGRLRRDDSYPASPNARSLTLRLAVGRYVFAVSASNAAGEGPPSARSVAVRSS
jgi:hypothetical protein